MSKILSFLSIVCLAAGGFVAFGATDQLVRHEDAQQMSIVYETLDSVFQMAGHHVAAPIFATQAKMMRFKAQQLLPYVDPRTIKAKAGDARVEFAAPEMKWQLSGVTSEVPYYILNTAFDLGGYPNNNPPYNPSSPYPANGATGIDLEVTLTWVGGDPDAEDIVTYDVYFGTQANPPNIATGLSNTSYAVSSLTAGTVYYWKIVSKDNFGGETIGSIWNFTTYQNHAPNPPVNPIPPDLATEVDINADLSWQANDPDPGDSLRFDVYFGTTNNPSRVAQNITEFQFEPGTLSTTTVYYWKIVARDDSNAETTGPIWQFTTISSGTNNPPYEPSNPSPSNGATGVWINEDLSWTGGDPDSGDTTVYDIYFGKTTPPENITQSYTGTSYDPGTMDAQTTYYWKIVSRDSHQAQTEGMIWSFVTGNSTDPTPTPNPTATPTPYAEPCVEYSVKLDMGGSNFCSGDTVYLEAQICNPDPEQYLPIFIILDIEGNYWFAPSWVPIEIDIDYFYYLIPHDWSQKTVISEFTWPNISGSYVGAAFWAAITDNQVKMILGNYDFYEFSWGVGCP